RDGRGRRWHRARGALPRARADLRSGDGRDPACRRRLRGGDPGRRGAGRRDPAPAQGPGWLMAIDLVIHNARVMTCDPAQPGLGLIDHGALAIADGALAWVGADAERPAAAHTLDAGGRLITPGLVDCHTHAI